MIMQSKYFNTQEQNWGATPGTLLKLSVIDCLPTWAKRFSVIRSRIFKSALRCAYINFVIQHPAWVNCLFDEQFLNNAAADLLAPIVDNGTVPQPIDLAIAWDKQVGPTSDAIRQQRITEITPAIADFLALLEAELTPQIPLTAPLRQTTNKTQQAIEYVIRDA